MSAARWNNAYDSGSATSRNSRYAWNSSGNSTLGVCLSQRIVGSCHTPPRALDEMCPQRG